MKDRTEYWKEYYQKNKARELIRTNEWRNGNRDRVNKKSRERYKRDPEIMKNHQKKYYENHSQKCIERSHKWRFDNLERAKLKDKDYYYKVKRRCMPHFVRRFKALQKVSGERIPRCCNCGVEDFRLLSINHMKGVKNHDERIGIDRKILNGERKIDDLEVRCHNCNRLYEFEIQRFIFNKKDFERILKEKGIILPSDSLK
jgi:hypothetical protein